MSRDPAGEWHPPTSGAPWIASIGHSDHGLAAFFDLLDRHQVLALVDVRRFPRSHVVHFNKDPLAAATREHRLAYHHLPALGGKREVPYPEHMRTSAWRTAYARLREIGMAARHAGGLAAFLCVERDPGRCHRRHIAERLEQDGWRLLHILPDAAQTRLF